MIDKIGKSKNIDNNIQMDMFWALFKRLQRKIDLLILFILSAMAYIKWG